MRLFTKELGTVLLDQEKASSVTEFQELLSKRFGEIDELRFYEVLALVFETRDKLGLRQERTLKNFARALYSGELGNPEVLKNKDEVYVAPSKEELEKLKQHEIALAEEAAKKAEEEVQKSKYSVIEIVNGRAVTYEEPENLTIDGNQRAVVLSEEKKQKKQKKEKKNKAIAPCAEAARIQTTKNDDGTIEFSVSPKKMNWRNNEQVIQWLTNLLGDRIRVEKGSWIVSPEFAAVLLAWIPGVKKNKIDLTEIAEKLETAELPTVHYSSRKDASSFEEQIAELKADNARLQEEVSKLKKQSQRQEKIHEKTVADLEGYRQQEVAVSSQFPKVAEFYRMISNLCKTVDQEGISKPQHTLKEFIREFLIPDGSLRFRSKSGQYVEDGIATEVREASPDVHFMERGKMRPELYLVDVEGVKPFLWNYDSGINKLSRAIAPIYRCLLGAAPDQDSSSTNLYSKEFTQIIAWVASLCSPYSPDFSYGSAGEHLYRPRKTELDCLVKEYASR